eukprot:gnl/TRDRNA2_/TRDRNA2_30703_c0_seq1.p1 gnl/TRDRNA2_/TRDRNA2_30703_c0~~gnl/TRDRNA2_/TRDRNA2_30703_c0_seq1.p1  ORF type:complete len:584 (+),score=83.56 gnl/TRDRNA2_/TRDRNA2_30703_c0_seq1:58-1752(+)
MPTVQVNAISEPFLQEVALRRRTCCGLRRGARCEAEGKVLRPSFFVGLGFAGLLSIVFILRGDVGLHWALQVPSVMMISHLAPRQARSQVPATHRSRGALEPSGREARDRRVWAMPPNMPATMPEAALDSHGVMSSAMPRSTSIDPPKSVPEPKVYEKPGHRYGVLIMNIGTPDEPTVPSVKKYLDEFLLDPDVVAIPTPLRYLLVRGLILQTRPRRIAPRYASIWMPDGSPLRVYSNRLAHTLTEDLDGMPCEVGMRYGNPSIRAGLERLREQGVTDLLLAPLFPHFAMATTGSSLKYAHQMLEEMGWAPNIRELGDFPTAPEFIEPLVASIQERMGPKDHVLFSYHGLPLSQNQVIDVGDAAKYGCLDDMCCAVPKVASQAGQKSLSTNFAPPKLTMPWDKREPDVDSSGNSARSPQQVLDLVNEVHNKTSACYAHQCVMTSLAAVARLGLPDDRWSISFQSKVGPAKWLEPATTTVVEQLAARGVERLVIVAPAFLADGLETLEELEYEVRELFEKAGGKYFTVVPCLNDRKDWAEGLAGLVEKAFAEQKAEAQASEVSGR